MPNPAPAKQQTSATIPYKKIKLTDIEGTPWYACIRHIVHLPGGQRIITCSWNGSFRVWDLETGVQVGEEWKDEKRIGTVTTIALSPDGKTLASGQWDSTVRLWNIDTGKVIKKWTGTGYTNEVKSVCWSSDGGRVVSRFQDGTFKGWDTESGRIILGPIQAGENVHAVRYSPDDKMIATAGGGLKVWDANTGELLTTIKKFVSCLVWTSDGKTLIAGGYGNIIKFDTATWSALELAHEFEETDGLRVVHSILLSPNERILASTPFLGKSVQLWNFETNQPIGPPLHHEGTVRCAAFFADGMFLTIGDSEIDDPMYKWDLCTIVKDPSLLSNNVDATRRPAIKLKGAPPRRIPPGFFGDERRADLSTSRIQSHGQQNRLTPPSQRTFPSFWRRRFNQHGATERGTQPWSSPFSWTRNIASGMVHRRDGSDIELREPPIVDVPCTASKPKNYHARRKKPAVSPSQRVHAHPAQQHTVPQGIPSSSQQPPPTATASTLPAVAGAAGVTGTTTHPHIAFTGWRARLMAWICCMPIQNAN